MSELTEEYKTGGFDISDFVKIHEVEFKNLPGIKFFYRRPTGEENDMAIKKGSNKTGGFENRSLFYKYLFEACVTDWSGLKSNGEIFPCTSENKKKLFQVNFQLCQKVVDELHTKFNAELEAEEKN